MSAMSNPRDPTRLRQGLNPLLTTSLGGYHNQLNTPLSAVSITSPLNPYSAHAHTPASAIQPYNPQEWIGSPIAGPERTHQFPASEAQAAVSPPPPPPYSPPRSQRPVSTVFEPPSANTSAARIPPTSSVHRPSPEPPATTSFPPPPGIGGRGPSRERRFGLSSLHRRKEHDQAASPPEPHPPSALSRHSIVLQIPQQVQRTPSGSSQTDGGNAPGARRSASTSAIETPTSARSRSTSQTRWEPGMPLPPPPPGPPPSQSRSQSAQGNRTAEIVPNPTLSPPTRRPPPSGVAALGPVPPTPANWVDQDEDQQHQHQHQHQPPPSSQQVQVPLTPPQSQQRQPLRGRSPALTLDTSSVHSSSNHASDSKDSGSSSGGPQSGNLARAGAVRHDKTIIQRRAESRTRSSFILNEGMSLSEIIVPSATTLSRRPTINKSTPRSAGRGGFSDLPGSSGDNQSIDSRHTTPRPLGSAQAHQHPETATPPFSPLPGKAVPMTDASPSVVPKALPTPPPQSRSASSSQSRLGMVTPGESAGPSSATSASIVVSKHIVVTQTAEQFCRDTIDRFQVFALKEAHAATDADRVRLFADFIVSESRIRRERYASAIGAMGSEIFDLTRDLFRPMSQRRESGASQAEWTPQSSEPNRSHRGSMNSTYRGELLSNSAPASANMPISPSGPPQNLNWQSNYMPSLSPILSLSVSGPDDGSSRGRPASRWWEAESNGVAGGRLERSKRESKYMGLPKEAHEALQWTDTPTKSTTFGESSDHGSAIDYPPEKSAAVWRDVEQSLTPQALRHSGHSILSNSAPNTPNPLALDVSRLVTMPPPYPRHHPAVNNNHPDLTSTRTAVRALSDLSEVEATKKRFQMTSKKVREDATKAAAEQLQSLRTNLQQEINAGHMTVAEAVAIETDLHEAGKERTKELEKNDYEQFQGQVVMPLNDLLTGRIAKATSLFDDLASRLFSVGSDTASSSSRAAAVADLPQEEGDDKPELLEKLTLLKWIFEAREMLHRAIYDLLSDRNDRYRDVVLTPYRLAGNNEKLRSAEAFFAEDAAKRQLDFANEVLRRTREFQAVVEDTVVRGVEVQLSAFWDIAPPLRRLLDKIPGPTATELVGFVVQIPSQEYDENPSYHTHPLQYLFSLVLHAEKSTYQFIESQTNLLCLLHEVKEAVVHAKARVAASEMEDANGEGICEEEREARADAMRREEGQRLTDDLKEKVRVVQDQWTSALGEGIKGVKQRVGEYLLETGGWDESLEDGDVGVV